MVTKKILQDLGKGDKEARRQIISQLTLPLDPTLIPILIYYLSDSSSAVCEAAVDALGNCYDPFSIGLIVSSLYSPNPVERNYVLEVIGKIGNPALLSVIMLMKDADRNIRKHAIDALVMIASEGTFFPLKQALKDPDLIVATSAAEALGQLHFKQAVPCLEEALQNGNEWMKVAVLTSLGNIGSIEALRVICNIPNNQPDTVMATVIQVVENAAKADNLLAINFLISLLKQVQSKFEGLILGVLEPLLQKNNHLSEDQLQLVIKSARKSLDHSNPSFCATAIKCLALISTFEPGELSKFAQSTNFLIRCAALQAMLITKDIDAQLVALIAFNSYEQYELRIRALRSLAKATDWNSSMEIQLFTITNQDDLRIRITAMNTLIQWGSDKGKVAFIKLFNDNDNWDEDIFISESLLNSSDFLLKLIGIGFTELDDLARYRMFHAIFPIDSKNELLLDSKAENGIILKALQDSYWVIRVHAVRLYAKKFPENGNLLALMASQDPDEHVRAITVNILNDQNKLDQELLFLLLHDHSERVRRAVFLIILDMDANKISPIVRTEALRISSSISENENKEFLDLFREVKRKFSNERI